MIGPLPRITDDEIAAVRAQAGLVDTISRRGVRLVRRGREHVGLCPFHKEKTPSFTVNEDKGFYHCFGCGAHGDVFDFVMHFANRSFREAVEDLHDGHGSTDPDAARRVAERQRRAEAERHAQDEREDRAHTEYARQMWRKAVPAPGTLVEVYLRSRGITIPVPPSLRYLAAAKYQPSGLILPAMVAAIQDRDGRITAIHRTYLRHDGRGKAGVAQPKMMLGPAGGGAVRLGLAGRELAICEGIESALSFQQATGITTWAALSVPGVCSLVLPKEISAVVLGPDGDDPGDGAAVEAARRFVREGRKVRIARPPRGMDWNDVLREPEKEMADA